MEPKKLTKILSISVLTILLFLVAVLVSLAWNNPLSAPPGGSAGVYVDTSGRVGIGIAAPGSKLSVNGSASVGAGYAGTAAPANSLIVEGNLGIGVPNPTNRLEVLSPSLKIGSGVSPFTGIYLRSSDGNFGIGTLTPGARLVVENGNAYVATQGQGLILHETAPGTNCRLVTVNNSGMLNVSSTGFTCP